jgi:4-hydroxy-tetrahydrodipicolinate synthase
LRSWRSGLARFQAVVAGAGASAQVERDPERYVSAAVRMAEEALGLGADALLVYPPTLFRDFPDRDARVVSYHEGLAALDAPLILFYLYEAAGGIGYSPAVLKKLLRLPQVIGIKMATLDSVMTFQDVARQIRAEQPEKLLITGEDRFLGYSLMCGADAALIGMGAACSRMQADLLRAHREGPAEKFLELSRKADALAAHTFVAPMEGYIRRMLWALAADGVIADDACDDPWGPPLPDTERETVRAAVHEARGVR